MKFDSVADSVSDSVVELPGQDLRTLARRLERRVRSQIWGGVEANLHIEGFPFLIAQERG